MGADIDDTDRAGRKAFARCNLRPHLSSEGSAWSTHQHATKSNLDHLPRQLPWPKALSKILSIAAHRANTPSSIETGAPRASSPATTKRCPLPVRGSPLLPHHGGCNATTRKGPPDRPLSCCTGKISLLSPSNA
jgi:hypothetical protein